MKEVAKYYISDKFIITGRGLMFAGHILGGKIKTGNVIRFCRNDKIVIKKIRGIEQSINNERVFDGLNTGILIECNNEEEIQQIRNSSLKDIKVSIFES